MKRFISLLNIILVLSMLLAACGPTPALTEAPASAPTEIIVKVELEQTDDNSPLSPKNRMCSNAQGKFRDVKYKVKLTPSNYTAFLLVTGTAGVTFPDGSDSKHGITNGSVVTLKAPNNSKGTWQLAAEVEQITEVSYSVLASESVFKFKTEFFNWAHSPGTATTRGSSATATGSAGTSSLEVATSGVGGTGDLGFQTSAQDNATAELKLITEPAGSFVGKAKADIRVEQIVYYFGRLVDAYIDNGSSGSASISVGPFSFAYNFASSGVGFMGQAGLEVKSARSYGAKTEVKSTHLGIGHFAIVGLPTLSLGTGLPLNI